MIANKELRETYLSKDLEHEFGENFLDKLNDLVRDFVDTVKKKLPDTVIDKVNGNILC